MILIRTFIISMGGPRRSVKCLQVKVALYWLFVQNVASGEEVSPVPGSAVLSPLAIAYIVKTGERAGGGQGPACLMLSPGRS